MSYRFGLKPLRNLGGASVKLRSRFGLTPTKALVSEEEPVPAPVPIYDILLEWQDNSDNETGFKIEHSPDGENDWTEFATVEAGVITYTVTEEAAGITEGFFRVRAYNEYGNSDYSNITEAI